MKSLKIVPKDAFDSFVRSLAEDGEVVAPVAREPGQYVYDSVSDASALEDEDYIPTLNPPKKYFMPAEEVLFKFTGKGAPTHSGVEVETEAQAEAEEEIVLLGVRPCDVAAIRLTDQAFEDTYEDEHYLNRRDAATIIAMNCQELCDEHAFCAAMGSLKVEAGYDLLLTDLGDAWAVAAGTEKGEQLLQQIPGARDADAAAQKKLQDLTDQQEENFENVKDRLDFPAEDLPEILGEAEDHPAWQEFGDECMGCGRCNLVCPTCFCFDVLDEVDLGLEEGERKRQWDGCTLLEFAMVAGGENFREDRDERLRHRFYRKAKYLPERYDGDMYCTGCGRCIRTCLVDIDPAEVFNTVAEKPGGEAS